MKRKLLIMLALAALATALWCGAATADNAFTTQPLDYSVLPDNYVTVSWATDFTPVRVEIGYDCGSYQTYFGSTTWVSDFKPQVTKTSDLKPLDSANVWYDKVIAFNYTDKWIVRAYYTSTLYTDSDFFSINRVERAVDVASSSYTIAPDSSVTVRWNSNFTPTRVEIGYDAGKYYTWFGESYWSSDFREVVTVTTGLSQSMKKNISYDAADIPPAYKDKWVVRAYYSLGSLGESYKDSGFFSVTCTERAVTAPADVNISPDASTKLSWSSNFNPVRVVIGYDAGKSCTWFGESYWSPDFHEVKSVDSGLSRSMSAYLSYDAALQAGGSWDHWQVRVYYGNASYQFVESSFFSARCKDRTVSTPSDVAVPPDSGGKVSWTSNFIPVQVEIGYDTGHEEPSWFGSTIWISDFHVVKTVTSGLGRSMSTYLYDRTIVDQYGANWKLRVYYGSLFYQYVDSSFFSVSLNPARSVSTPSNVTATQNDGATVSWTSTFTPVRVQVGYLERVEGSLFGITYHYEEFHEVRKIETELTRSMSCYIPYDSVPDESADWEIRAYYADNNASFVKSEKFSINKCALAFTDQPGDAILSGAGCQITWDTSFDPTSVVLYQRLSAGAQEVVATLAGTRKSYTFANDAVTEYQTYFLRAYDSDGQYVDSRFFFIVPESAIRFVMQPEGGEMTYQESFDLSWALSIPVISARVERRAKGSSDEWATFNGVQMMSSQCAASLRYAGDADNFEYRVYALCGSEAASVPKASDTFYMTIRHYTVSFDMQGFGDQIAPISVPEHTTLTELPRPAVSGFTFGGWYTDAACTDGVSNYAPVTQDMTLYALWGHEVQFDANAAMMPGYNPAVEQSAPGVRFVRHGSAVSRPDYYATLENSYNGWIVTGWYLESDCVTEYDFSRPVTADIRLYARWAFDGYTAVFDWNGAYNVVSYKHVGGTHIDIDADEPQFQRVRPGECFDELVPLRFDGAGAWRSFTGWYTEPECVNPYDFTAPATADIALYAGWGANHTLVMHKNRPNGGYTSPFYYTIPWNEVPSDDEWLCYDLQNWDHYTGYVPDGWYTDEDGTVPFDPDAPLTGTTHIYNKWAVAAYTVSFDAGAGAFPGGGSVLPVSVLHGNPIEPPASEPTREGYTLLGWNKSSGYYAGMSFDGLTCTGDVTYYAIWALDGGVPINYANFQGSAFRAYVKSTYDTDGDGYLSQDELAAVTLMDIGGQGFNNLHGINNFFNLKTLKCQDNGLTYLGIGMLENLTYLNCSGNQLSSLDLSGNGKLGTLIAFGNNIASLDLTHNEMLSSADVSGNAPMATLNLRSANLTSLYAYGTSLDALDLSACRFLIRALKYGAFTAETDYDSYVYKLNQYQKYTLHVNPGFDAAACVTEGLPIDEAHFPDEGFRKLVGDKWHDLNGNGYLSDDELNAIASLSGGYAGTRSLAGIEYLPNVSYIDLKGIGLEEIDLSGNPLVNTLVVRNNSLTSVDVSMLSELTYLNVANNPGLSALILGDGLLETLNCYGCPLIRSLDLSTQPQLLKAYVDGEVYEDEYEGVPYVMHSWMNEGETILGFLRVDADIAVALPEWDWVGVESAWFILPNGAIHPADVAREVSADGKSVSYTAAVTLSGVPFSDSKTFCLVTFSGADVPAQTLIGGDCVTRPDDPSRVGRVFGGWYADAACTQAYDFGAPVTEGFTLYARWIDPAPADVLKLPAMLTRIEADAFQGVAAEAVVIPSGVTDIVGNPFADGGVRCIYGYPGTAAETFAEAYGFTFVPIDAAWLAAH